MLELFKYLVEHAETIAQVIGLAGAIGIAYKYAKKLFYKIRALLHTIESMQKIAYELSPNGGSSLKDAIARIEKRQIRTEQREKAVLSESFLPMFEADADGHCIWINRAYRTLVGRNNDELLGQGWENILHSDDQERVLQEWKRAVDGKRDFESEYRILNKEKNIIIPINCRSAALRNSSGECIGWLGTLRIIEKTSPVA